MIHTVKCFSVVNEAEVDTVFLEFPFFFYDQMDIGNLISACSAFSKSACSSGSSWFRYCWSLPLKILRIHLASMWYECNCAVVWTFFSTALFWYWNQNLTFPVLWSLWVFKMCWHIECSTLTASSIRIWKTLAGIPSPPLAFFVTMLPKGPLDFMLQDVWL